ncbi:MULTISPECIES: ATP-binding protein [unclassified Streptomyces]|uniref:ATP-binding protein n=1 Tax=unclassified Streptomyces TaxID=2593676 RepID=UPI00333200D5
MELHGTHGVVLSALSHLGPKATAAPDIRIVASGIRLLLVRGPGGLHQARAWPRPVRPAAGALTSTWTTTREALMPEATQRFFDHRPESVKAARDFTTRTLIAWGLYDTGDICLVVSELATNALAHGSDRDHGFLVRLEPDPGGVRLEVHDSSDPCEPLPEPARPAFDTETGRGLVIVAALVARWGVEPRQPYGKIVWFNFPTAPPTTTVRAGREARTC